MDQCLKVPEIIRFICDGLGSDSNSAYSMALVAKRFVEPALDIRWRSVPSLIPIISCLPDDLWTVKMDKRDSQRQEPRKIVVLQRAVTPADLKRYLNVYAPRIRNLGGWNRSFSVSSQVLQALQVATDFKSGALSPCLEAYQTAWLKPESLEEDIGTEYSANIGASIWLFIHPGMTGLDISASSSDPLYLSSIQLTATRLPNLKDLTIGIGYESVENPFVDGYLASSSWDQLEKLQVHVDCADQFPYLVPRTIRQLARLPLLESLSLLDLVDVPSPDTGLDGNTLPMGPWPYPFASLTTLFLTTVLPTDMIAFLGYLPTRNKLTSLTCESLNETSDEDIQTIVNIVHDRCDHGVLKEFTLRVNEYGGEEEEAIEMDEDGGLNIEPLLAFNKLESLEIVINGRYRLTPEVVAQMPSSWPAMETMIFHSTFQTTQIPLIDHMHLLALVEGLPLLDYLRIRFDGTKISGHELAMSAPIPLYILHVGDSPISSPSRVISFIKANFSLGRPPSIDSSNAWKVPLYKTRWEVVTASNPPW